MATSDLLTTIANNVPLVYESGKKDGFEEGKQAEYDAFWDNYQTTCNGDQFSGNSWTNETFKPKYDIVPTSGYMLFYNSQIEGDLVEILNERGVKLDTSKCTNFQYMFQGTLFTRVGVIDTRMSHISTSGSMRMFSTSKLKTIDELIVLKSFVFHNECFRNASGLENLKITGTVGSALNLSHSSKLNKASIESVINALSDETENLTVTFSLTAVDNAFETTEGLADGSASEEWLALKATKPNWNIDAVSLD